MLESIPLLSSPRFNLLLKASGSKAVQYVLFDRDDTDSYRIQIAPVGSSDLHLTQSQIAHALPVGSRWADAVGWESYVVYPGRCMGIVSKLDIVGLEFVVSHPSRTAYPVFGGVIVPAADTAEVLRQLAFELNGVCERAARTHGATETKSMSPVEHIPIAAGILRAAATACDAHEPQLVRTVLLTEDEIPGRFSLSTKFLVATVPHIRERFSLLGKSWLRAHRRFGSS